MAKFGLLVGTYVACILEHTTHYIHTLYALIKKKKTDGVNYFKPLSQRSVGSTGH